MSPLNGPNAAAIEALAPLLEDAEARLLTAASAELDAQVVLAASQALVGQVRGERDRLLSALDALNGRTCSKAATDAPNVGAGGSIPSPVATPPPKPARPPGPYDNLECAGCGDKGTLFETFRTIKGNSLRFLVCGGCSSERRI